jgi:hypothetical protein
MDDPASTRARFSTAPTPVMIPQPMSAAQWNGTRGSIAIAPCSRTVVAPTKADAFANAYARVPSPSVNGWLSFGFGAFRHSVGRPTSHAGQRPQWGERREDDGVPLLDRGHARADRVHHTRALVPSTTGMG